MALEDILAAVRRRAEAEAEEILAEARRRAEAILTEADRRAAEDRETALARAEAATRAEAERIVDRARLDAQRIRRQGRDDLYREAHRRMRDELVALRSDDRYPAVLAAIYREAAAALEDATRILVDARDRDVVGGIAAGDGRRVVASLRTWGGLRFESDDGRAVDDTFEVRAARAEDRLRRILLLGVERGTP